jgi:nucleoid-associated protein YgaU
MADTKDYKQELVEKLRENYLSVALGVLVFLVALTLVFRSGDAQTNQADTAEDDTVLAEQTYVVQLGDSVSSIAREQMGSVDFADEIIAANKLENPDALEVGMKLTLPTVEADADDKMAPTGAMEPTATPMMTPVMKGDVNGDGATATKMAPITGGSYTVMKGDHLWDIAVRAYGDGNMYTTIIEANALRNPDRLEEGTVLKLPRKATK